MKGNTKKILQGRSIIRLSSSDDSVPPVLNSSVEQSNCRFAKLLGMSRTVAETERDHTVPDCTWLIQIPPPSCFWEFSLGGGPLVDRGASVAPTYRTVKINTTAQEWRLGQPYYKPLVRSFVIFPEFASLVVLLVTSGQCLSIW